MMDRQSIHFLNVEILQVEIVITFPIYLQVQQVYLDYFFYVGVLWKLRQKYNCKECLISSCDCPLYSHKASVLVWSHIHED